ncbi:hypothetical protein CGX12_08475 [Zobellella denitrificans]|jgi:uncharacterized protein YjiS (DUF1127 family)|uniref:YjiS-like domain-containing protein n=1 Tax=Zobellella denitrificans TaxID=347534 RepID=A0A231MZW8_9GAMM|nr:DUF1127 domain-containing protein [Zobellella denitrificans]ATG73914.1 hypothetical protein AN401_08640 [Zobellella denitrificans]OXS15525.1 hypothetical protein CGX12_08475 [Zobellella denitrificans]
MNSINYHNQDLVRTEGHAAHTGLLATLGLWLHRSRTRRQLSELPAYLLKDIGLNEADRYQEVSKPFWQQ